MRRATISGGLGRNHATPPPPPPTVTIGTWDTSADPVSRTLVATSVSGDFTMNAAFSTDYSYWSDQVHFSGVIGNTSIVYTTHDDAHAGNRKFTTVVTPGSGETVFLSEFTVCAVAQNSPFSVAFWVNGVQEWESSVAGGTEWGALEKRTVTADLSTAGPFDPDEVVTIDITIAPMAIFAYSFGVGADPADVDSLKLTGSVA